MGTPENLARTLAVAIAVVSLWVAVRDWNYLQSGYSLGVAVGDSPVTSFDIVFPAWRKVAHAVIWLAVVVGAWAVATRKRHAATLCRVLVGIVAVVGIVDVVQYGSIHTPTTKAGLLLPVALALCATLQRRAKAPPT